MWTLAVWLPRIGIIPVNGVWEYSRIAVSLILGVGTSLSLVKQGSFTKPLLYGFAAWSVAVWGRSVWNYWTLDNPLDLRLVHTVLAAGFFYLAWRAFTTARRDPIAEPDQGDGDEKRDSEAPSLS